MGNFTLKTDSYLNQFALFKGINKLLKEYQDTPLDKIPSLSQLIADKLYHEWLDLANIVSELDDWTEEDWNNFNISMSLAESCKNRVDSISYALQGLGWNFTGGDSNEMITTSSGTTIKIYVDHINTSPRLDQIRSKLKRCIEYLILTKNPDVEFNINNVDISIELSTGTTSDDILSEKEGILLEADVSQISTTITIHIFNSIGSEVNSILSYKTPDSTHLSGYYRYDVKIKDEDSGEYILDPALYRISALYQVGASSIRIDERVFDDLGWVEDETPYPGTTQSYSRTFPSLIATLSPGKHITVNMTPASIEDELRISEAEMFLSNIENGSITLTCTHLPLDQIHIKLMSYYTEEYEDIVTRFNVTLPESDWDATTMTLTVDRSEIHNVDDLIVASRITDPQVLNICNMCEVRVDSVSEGLITFKCNVRPETDIVIPMEISSRVSQESTVAPIVSEENPIPSVYFDKDSMILWVAKGQGNMDYSMVDVILNASHIYNGNIVSDEINITWEEMP